MPARKKPPLEENKDRRLELADRLIELMEKGEAHWQKPWVAGAVQPPTNAVTGKPYRGVNSEYLFAFSPDPTDNRWCTYKQAQEQGWQVRKGEHALAFIEKYTPYERKPTEEERQNRIAQGGDPDAPVQSVSIRHYPVFHASQIDGIPPLERGPQPEMEGKPDPRIEKLAEEMGVQVTRGGGRAFYRSLTDTVNLPPVESFHTATGHDTTFLHELSHATGHESRLNRELGNPFGSEKYALEELRAEMAAAMTAASLGIGFDPAAQGVEEGRETGNTAAYLASWLSALPDKERKQILMQTIKDAQAMSDYLLERTPELQVEQDRGQTKDVGKDVEIRTVEHPEIAMEGEGKPLKARFWSKVHDAEDIARLGLEHASDPAMVRVARTVRMDAESYDRLTSQLLQDAPVLAQVGGTNTEDRSRYVVELQAPDRQRLFLDTQGYDYPRYVGIPEGDIERVLERGSFVVGPDVERITTNPLEVEKPSNPLDKDIVAHLEERNRVRQSEHPGYAGLGDPVANAEDFTTRFAQRNPVVAREWAEAIRADMSGYSEAVGLSPDSLALIASQMDAGAKRMERPQVGDLVRFEPHDKDPLHGEPFSGRVIAALDTSGGDVRYHLRAENGPDQGVESTVYGKNGAFRLIGIEQAYGFDRNAPERLSPEERAIQEYKAFYDQMPERADKLIAETRERASKLAPADFHGFSEMARDFSKGVDAVFGIIPEGEHRGASAPDLRLSEALSTTYIAELPVVRNAHEQSQRVGDRFQAFDKELREEFREKLREHGKELLRSGTLQEPREMVQAVYWKHGIEVGPDSPIVNKLTTAVQDKDLKVLLPLIGHNSQNPGSEEAFSRLTGVKLGKTQKERVAQLEVWAGPERVAALRKEREDVQKSRAEEAPRKAVRQAFDALAGINVRLSEKSVETMDGQKWLEAKVSEGYTTVGTHKKGAITLRHLENPNNRQTVWLKDSRFQSYCKAIQALEPSGDVAKAMETAKIPLDVKLKEVEPARDSEKAPETQAPNPYEEKQKARQERYLLLAEKARAKALARLDQAKKMADAIPFGQPILVGHHSEGRDRRYRGRIHDTFGKGFKLLEKAEYYERRAKGVNGTAISADDPQAVEKLKAKIETLKAAQERMKAANAAIRKHQKEGPEAQQAALEALGFKPDQAKSLLTPDVMGNIGFASYSLTNNNANIRRLEERVKVLEKSSSLEDRTTEFAWGKVRENKEINRIQFLFDGKPDQAIRDLMKKSGFRWAPSEDAWQRQWTGNAVYAAREAIKKLEEWYPASRDREAPQPSPEPAPDKTPEHSAPSQSHDPAPMAAIRGRDGTRYALSLREKDGEVLAKLEIAGGETAEAPLQPFRSAKIPDTEKLAARLELSDGRTLAVRLSPGNGGVEADLLCAEATGDRQSFTWKRLNDAPGKLRADGVNSPEAKWVAERLGVDARVMQRPELAAGVGAYRAPEKTREQAWGMDR